MAAPSCSYSMAILFSLILTPAFTTSNDSKAESNNVNAAARSCNARDISIYQSPSGFTASHVPKFSVEITNESPAVNGVYDVEVNCGDFASTTLVNPMIFRRLQPGRCLVKNGGKVKPGEVISFVYSNLFAYNFTVSVVKC